MFYLRLSVLLLPLTTILLSQVLIFFPKILFLVILLISFFLIFWCYQLLKNWKSDYYWWSYSVLPVIFHISSILYFSIEPNLFIGQFIVFLNCWFQFTYLKNLYYLTTEKEKRVEQLKNISFFGGVLVVFFSASTAYGIRAFLGYPLLPIFLGLALFLVASWYQIFVYAKFSFKKNLDFFLIALLVVLQFAFVLFFLPFNYRLLAVIMTIAFYFVVGVGRFYLQGNFLTKHFRYYFIFSILATCLLLLTARWL